MSQIAANNIYYHPIVFVAKLKETKPITSNYKHSCSKIYYIVQNKCTNNKIYKCFL